MIEVKQCRNNVLRVLSEGAEAQLAVRGDDVADVSLQGEASLRDWYLLLGRLGHLGTEQYYWSEALEDDTVNQGLCGSENWVVEKCRSGANIYLDLMEIRVACRGPFSLAISMHAVFLDRDQIGFVAKKCMDIIEELLKEPFFGATAIRKAAGL